MPSGVAVFAAHGTVCDMSLRLVVLSVSIALLVGCGGGLAPVLQIESAAAVDSRGAPMAAAQVQQVVYAGLLAKQWNIDNAGPGYFIATTRTGEHFATVRVDYGDGGYAIHYVNASPSLRFSGDRIHRRYNNWIDRLDSAIRGEMSRAATASYVVVPQPAQTAPPPVMGPPLPEGKPPSR